MKRQMQILISLLTLLSIQTLVLAGDTYYVPSRDYPTIQSAINAAAPANDDVVIVAPGVYSGTGNIDLDFHGKAITVRSEINPANPNPNIIAATIIDCQGSSDFDARAFYFHTGEDHDSKVMGFTIRNGYARGPIGADGQFGFDGYDFINGSVDFVPYSAVNPAFCDTDECPPFALPGDDATGNGFGGAIFCNNASSPTIQYCVITNCTVTGGQGGRGADGMSGPWFHWTLANFDPNGDVIVGETQTLNNNGQWAGHGGAGIGNGYGGAIACNNGSHPIISDCIIKNNIARGGCGGEGGDGGFADGDPPNFEGGFGSFGGYGGLSRGDGIGGAIYAANGSSPVVINCTFSNNTATTGLRAQGGMLGLGNTIDVDNGGPATDGASGAVLSYGGIAGGVAYFDSSDSNFTNCTFTGNKAYRAYQFGPPAGMEDIWMYEEGGAFYSTQNNNVTLVNCDFIDNLGGAVYCEQGSVLNINNNYDPNRACLFANNSEIANGGAIFINVSSTVDIRGCSFTGNSAYDDGGALKCRSDANFTNCLFGGNRADSDDDGSGYGGAIDAYRPGATLVLDFNSCSFVQNRAVYGGGFSSENFDVNFINCYFVGNTAEQSGGLDLVNGDLVFVGGAVSGNKATDGDGGGFGCRYTETDIRNCVITGNSAAGTYPYGGNGGAVSFYGGTSTNVFNCLVVGNSAATDGGAISCYGASPEIGNCTFSADSAEGYGGAIFSNFISDVNITDCIFEGCNSHAIYEEDSGGNATVKYSLFYNNPDGDYYDSGTGMTYSGYPEISSIPGGINNLYGMPRFVNGPLSDYYLSQIDAGQAVDSPAVDSGSDTASNLGLDTFTTRINNIEDAGQVDRGYHHPNSVGIGVFQLTASVAGGHGTIEPASDTYYAGTVVTLTATPASGWRVKAWNGADNDDSTAKTNTVVMNSDRNVTVEFGQPQTLDVPGDYPTLQAAIDAANSGDTIILAPAATPYRTSFPYIIIGEEITITGTNPDDPAVVANTAIEWVIGPEGYTDVMCFYFQDVGPNTVLSGITIQGFEVSGYDGLPGNPDLYGYDGRDGEGMYGGAILCNFASPTIKNCIITDCSVSGGNGGAGANGDDDHPNGGHGGWPGRAYGGGLACVNNSNPVVTNCLFDNCRAIGGNGGDGAQGNTNETAYGFGGRGGGWYYSTPPLTAYEQGPYEFYTRYSGYGGAVYVAASCTPKFIDCTFNNNRTISGVCGIHGQDGFPPENRPQPTVNWKIDSFGGAVYCDSNSSVDFIGCEFNSNVADLNIPPDNDDSFAGFGGAVALKEGADFTFEDCTFNGNSATVGGGMYWSWSELRIGDCNFVGNAALQGGGLFSEHGMVDVFASGFNNNIASSYITDINDPNVLLGTGGGMYFWATDVDIIDCDISYNQAVISGGGVYFRGESTPILNNCLLTNNTAARDGGGVSTNVFASPTISNCTIADNLVTGIGFENGYGGGVYCSYDSYTNIIDSIVWDNSAQYGPQLAIGTGFEYDPRVSTIEVSYSDVQGGQAYVFVDNGCTFNWGTGNINQNPLFVTGPLGNYYLSQIASGQAQDSNCVNSGSDSAENLGMDVYTTRTDEKPDRNVVDMGYHYMFTPDAQPCRFAELFRDGIINLEDYALLVLNIPSENCSEANDWCYHSDITFDTFADVNDVAFWASCEFVEDIYPPVPNPSEWQKEPYSSSANPNSVSMVAVTSADAWDFWGGNVWYYFDCVYGNCHDSGWQKGDPNYTDTGLVAGGEYGYRVRARDDSYEVIPPGDIEPNNKTQWSPIRYVTAGEDPIQQEDHTPPLPDPMTWSVVPNATSSTSISMTATTAVDACSPPVQYFFECTDNDSNSGWQSGVTWIDTSVVPETTYNYRVRARDTSAWLNETGWSTVMGATTPAEGGGGDPNENDTNPPVPVQWEVLPYETGGGLDSYANMTAAEATDLEGNGPVEYYFECVSIPAYNSGWTIEREWNDYYIGRSGKLLKFHFRVRDSVGNVSAWSTSETCYP